MADEDLRALERQAAQGDDAARARLVRARVRQGALRRGTFLLSPPERVDAWLRASGIDGVDVHPGRVDASRHADITESVAGVARLRWWTPYDRPEQIRLVLANLIERLAWADPSRVAIQPVARLAQFEVVVQLYLFDPLRMFTSEGCVRALRGGDATLALLASVVDRALSDALNAMREGDRARFERGLQELLFTGYSSAGRAEAERFEAALSGELERTVRDLRLASDLRRSQRGLLETLDEWTHCGRRDPAGGVVGKEWALPVWTTFRRSYGVTTIPELCDEGVAPRAAGAGPPPAPAPTPRVGAGGGRPRPDDSQGQHEEPDEGARVPAGPAPAQLYAKVADASSPDQERRRAGVALLDLPREAGGTYQVRALAWGYSELLARATSFSDLAPFFEELALARSGDRLEHALALLRDLGQTFDDPLRAWERAQEVRGASLTSLHQDTILRALPRSHPPLVPLLIAELERVADDQPPDAGGPGDPDGERLVGGGSRTSAWIQAALRGLANAAASEGAAVALRLTRHPDAGVCVSALSFFSACDHPSAAPALQAALDADSLERVAAAEVGLSGQTSLSGDALYAALAKLDARAAAARGEGPFLAQQLGGRLLAALARFGVPEQPGRVQLVERVAARGSWLSDDASRFVALVAHETRGGEPLARPAVGGSPVETFSLRISRWRQPGYVRRRYGEAGHRDPAWDAWVQQAHTHYDAERSALAGPLFQRALDAGCRDGLVLYRRAHTALEDSQRALSYLRDAARRLPEQYPESPYAACAWEGIGNLLSRAGEDAEALAALRQARGDVMCPPEVPEAIARLEARVALRSVSAAELRPVNTGSLKPWPSSWHSAPVTSVAVSPDGACVASADESGWVQVSLVDGEGLLPVRGAEVHAPGRVALAWRDADTLLSAGEDGRLCVLDTAAEPPRLGVTERLRRGAPLTAVALADSARVLLGDAQGVVLLAEGPEVRPLERRDPSGAPVRSLLTSDRWWVAHGGDGRLEVWDVRGAPAHVGREAFSFVTFAGDDALAVGLPSGLGVRLRLPSGRRLGDFEQPRSGRPLYVTHVAGRGSVFAWPRGPIRVTADRGLTYVIKSPLVAAHAVVAQRVGAFADVTGKLSVFRWGS